MPENKNNTILLVDDDATDLYVYSRALSAAGFRVITTLIGTDFLGIHHNEKPALILLDYVLNSSVTAAEVAKILKDMFPGVPILVFSGGVQRLPKDMLELAPAFCPKGEPGQIVALVRSLLPEQTSHDTSGGTSVAETGN